MVLLYQFSKQNFQVDSKKDYMDHFTIFKENIINLSGVIKPLLDLDLFGPGSVYIVI